MQSIEDLFKELGPAFQQATVGKYALALAGAHAKGRADEHSDVDFFLFAEDLKPREQLSEIFSPIADSPGTLSLWGGGIDFEYKGVKIETTIRILRQLYADVDECLQGKIRITPEYWTLNGYYNYVHLAEIDFVKPLDDPYGIIANLKQSLGAYPPALKSAIIAEFWPRCLFWLNNFHYISAINRKDIVYTSGIIHNTFHSIVQLLFALNETYFCGDKKIELQLSHLKFCPQSLLDNVEFLMTTGRDVDFLQRQRDVLLEVTGEIGKRFQLG